MKCLIDSDILLYEIGFASEAAWKYMGLEGVPPFDFAEEQLLARIAQIEMACEADEPSLFFLTGKTNFRTEIAKTQPYKDRPGHKPFHYANIRAYIKGLYPTEEREGFEADDLMAIYQTDRIKDRSTIICTRDKDLRAVAGWHYGWELNNQPSFGPKWVEGFGDIALGGKPQKLTGYGLKFFLSQCLTGDRVDGVPGLPKYGPVKAFETLQATTTYAEGLEAVREAYRPFGGDDYLLEQGRLLWMTREMNAEEKPVLWDLLWREME